MEGARVAASRLRRFKTIFRQAHYWRGSGAQLLRSRRTWQRVLSERLEASAAMGKGAAGDRDPETMEGGGWAVLEPLPALNTAEIMEHHKRLMDAESSQAGKGKRVRYFLKPLRRLTLSFLLRTHGPITHRIQRRAVGRISK